MRTGFARHKSQTSRDFVLWAFVVSVSLMFILFSAMVIDKIGHPF
jgi:hypothetical protein